jgi:hypothetical protein
MSAGSISLEAAIRTCKVDTAYANKVQSDRFLNPENMVCPIWNGVDTAGRRVSPDSFWTKNGGCNSAEDRVVVENNQRPQYMEYINLSANGIDGAIYGQNGGSKEAYGNSMPWVNSGIRDNVFNFPTDYQQCLSADNQPISCNDNVTNVTGNFGLQLSSDVYPSCGYYPYAQAMAQEQQALRQQQALQEGYYGNYYKNSSGF